MANFSERMNKVFNLVLEKALEDKRQYTTPEHLLIAMLDDEAFVEDLRHVNPKVDVKAAKTELEEYVKTMPPILFSTGRFEASALMARMLEECDKAVMESGDDSIDFTHICYAMLNLDPADSAATLVLYECINWRKEALLRRLAESKAKAEAEKLENQPKHVVLSITNRDEDLEAERGKKAMKLFNEDVDYDEQPELRRKPWHSIVTLVNAHVDDHNPLIGREKELDRTIQVLCRKDKNNPLHIGEPGVGKTAIIYGLADRINRDEVPDALKGTRIYQLEMASLVAGTQYRGDFEERLQDVLNGVQQEGNAIIYIDEIHNIVGAGQLKDSTLDASNILKPYLEEGKVRFIGATTYEEYNRDLARSKGLMRRFQNIDIQEPSVDEALHILRQLKPAYEQFHGITYSDEALEFAVKASARHITERFLPDKAIDLIDETGAYLQAHPEVEKREVDKELVAQVLAKITNVDALALDERQNEALESLQPRMLSQIYGQDKAVETVVEAIQMAKAGLTDELKPLASLLFVGPTGVGKTEVAKVLAKELGVELVRFDMSEFVEKHSVAKLIGSPAGYVGYDDGGLLTDAVRKHPDCVLLLDEIEKAHDDVFNILLQVMDYGALTDNKGRKAFFRNVVLIMTSNAGAQFARQASVGFNSMVTAGKAMLKQVKKTFKPEFINRLSDIVVFNDMDRDMASLILDKKLRLLQGQLTTKNVTLDLTDEAREMLLNEGFSQEYGAREMDRTIHRLLKTELMREILYGTLKNGGTAKVIKTPENDRLKVELKKTRRKK